MVYNRTGSKGNTGTAAGRLRRDADGEHRIATGGESVVGIGCRGNSLGKPPSRTGQRKQENRCSRRGPLRTAAADQAPDVGPLADLIRLRATDGDDDVAARGELDVSPARAATSLLRSAPWKSSVTISASTKPRRSAVALLRRASVLPASCPIRHILCVRGARPAQQVHRDPPVGPGLQLLSGHLPVESGVPGRLDPFLHSVRRCVRPRCGRSARSALSATRRGLGGTCGFLVGESRSAWPDGQVSRGFTSRSVVASKPVAARYGHVRAAAGPDGLRTAGPIRAGHS